MTNEEILERFNKYVGLEHKTRFREYYFESVLQLMEEARQQGFNEGVEKAAQKAKKLIIKTSSVYDVHAEGNERLRTLIRSLRDE